jgi:hypothetical protein
VDEVRDCGGRNTKIEGKREGMKIKAVGWGLI